MSASTTLGKRKDREEGHGSTLFVSNLPYSATSVDLQTLFSDIAPVRSAFVVTEQGTGVSKGVGYVSFAIKEDAESALETITRDGITLVGRGLRVQWANQKVSKKDQPTSTEVDEPSPQKPKVERKPRPQQIRPPNDPLAIRTIVVSGLPSGIESKALWKKMRKYDGAEELVWPLKLDDQTEDPSIAHVQFSTPESASKAVDKLHAHVFKGALLSVALKKRLDKITHISAKPSAAKTSTPSRSSRLIVRNLPFDATEQDLRAIFLPHGPIFSIHIPTTNVTDDQGQASKSRSKGFAFVWMVSKKDAEKAMEACNGVKLRSGLAASLASDKQKKKKLRRIEQKIQAGEAGNEGAEEGVDEGGRVIAVDWALSKDRWAEEMAKAEMDEAEAEDAEEVAESDKDSGDEDEDAEDGSESEESEEGSELGLHEDEDEASDEDDNDESDEEREDQPVKPQLPQTDVGTTLFVRNVPFDATEDDLRTLFRAFGPLRYARITIDHETGRSRGTGFACFWNKEDADKVIHQSELLRLETMGSGNPTPKSNPFVMPSILTPDPSSSLAQSLVLHGRTLDVVRAVTRDVAHKLKEDGEKQREKADKRNLYLLREGVILPNSKAAESLGTAEIERRTTAFNRRRTLLRSNPSLFMSKTRLSVRQIPLFVTERMLKRLAIHAIRAFKTEVKEGRRDGLTEDELAVTVDADDSKDVSKGSKGRPGRNTGVKQAKIVRLAERVDPVTGKGRSKGYGFVELHKHADALRVLRWTNNNPEAISLFKVWWKEELEDLIKLEKQRLKTAQGDEADESRLKRMKDELEKGTPKSSKDSLVVEFSIENIQVVQRRATMQKERAPDPSTEHEQGSKDGKRKPSSAPDTGESKRSPEKRRHSADDSKASTEEPTQAIKKSRTKDSPSSEESTKLGNKLGSLIGRKRKQRQKNKL
ncbi:hypothetical protein ONZ45_g11162 [Pleurotus djamor]|nr:hypothetical protein ONZ45_g11162 [Pleurotus djamor]